MVATALDTNVLMTLLRSASEGDARRMCLALKEASVPSEVLVSPVVCAELLAAPLRDEAFLETFLKDTRVRADACFARSMWRNPGLAFGGYGDNRAIPVRAASSRISDRRASAHLL